MTNLPGVLTLKQNDSTGITYNCCQRNLDWLDEAKHLHNNLEIT